ncbi:MAG: hypothetical protein ACK4MF_00760, partial [Hyphomicrobiaceae bacterium]
RYPAMSQTMALLSPDMTDAERRMVVAAVRGEVGDLGGAAVRGSVLRDLLLEARPGWLLPRHGVSLARMTVVGGLDLDGAVLDKPLTLSEVHVETIRGGTNVAIALGSTRMRRFTLHASTVAGAILADRAEVVGALLIGGGEIAGPLHLRSAVVHGSLAIEGAAVGDSASAVQAAGLQVDGTLVLRRSRFSGTASLARCRINGNLHGEEVRIAVTGGHDLDLDAARIAGDVTFDRAAMSRGMTLVEARFDGRLSVASATVGEAGISARGARIDGAILATEARLSGPIRIDDTAIGGGLSARGMEVHGGEAAVVARRARFGASVDAQASKIVGTVDLASARIDGELRLASARLFGAQRALDARGIKVDGDCQMLRTVAFGTIDLSAAVIGGALSLNGASLKVDRGAALDARRARIAGGVGLGDGLDAIGAIRLDRALVEHGAVDLAGSRVVSVHRASGAPGQQNAPRPPSSADDRIAIGLSGLRAASLAMPVTAEQRPRGIVDLGGAQVGEYRDHAAAWPPANEARGNGAAATSGDDDVLVLDGFTYCRLTNPAGAAGEGGAGGATMDAAARRIAWLEAQPAGDLEQMFKPQPWREAASRLAEQGLPGEARRVMLAALRRQRRSARSRRGRWAGLLDDALTGYGYAPLRPLLILVVATLAFAAAYAWADMQCRGQTRCPAGPAFMTDGNGAGHAGFNAIAYAVEQSLPVLDLQQRRHWRANPAWQPGAASAASHATTTGLMLEYAAAFQSLLGVVLAALALIGLVRAPRRV